MRDRGSLAVLFAVSASGCAYVLDLPEVHRGDCSPDAEFIELAPVRGLGTLPVQSASLSRDELTIVFSRMINDGTAVRGGDLYLAHRDHPGDAFRDATALDELNTEADEFRASLSSDLRTLYFDRSVQELQYEILVATRSSADTAFGAPSPVSLGALGHSDFEPFITADGLYFASTRINGYASLFVAPGRRIPFDVPEWLSPLQTLTTPTAYETPVVASDGLAIYFSAAPDRTAAKDVWMARRLSREQPFESPQSVVVVNTTAAEIPAWTSADSCRLYFTTDRMGPLALWMASRRAL